MSNQNSKESRTATQVIMWTLLIIIYGTILGAWVMMQTPRPKE
jgi:hypothetical protein